MTPYQESLQDPRWVEDLKPRVLARDNNTCRDCGAHTVIVHHCAYLTGKSYDTPPDMLVTACEKNGCHAYRNTVEFEARMDLARVQAQLRGREQQETFYGYFKTFLKNAAQRLGLQPLPPTPPSIPPPTNNHEQAELL